MKTLSTLVISVALILGPVGCAPAPAWYSLTVAVAPGGGGTAADLTDASPYAAGTSVSIKAVAMAGYHFVNWKASAGTFGNATAARTTFRMPAQNVTVTANFGHVVAPPATAWTKTFGGSGDEGAYSVQQTSDGGYIIVGGTGSYGAGYADVWLIKTDSAGNVAWNKTFGGSGYESGHSGQQTSDGGYVIAGHTTSYGDGWADVWLIKADSSGSVAWNRTFGGSHYDSGNSVQQTSDGGYIIAGDTESYGAGYGDVLLIKADSSGNVAWNRTFGGSDKDRAALVQQTADEGYIIVGTRGSYERRNADVLLMKTDSSGSLVWTETFAGQDNDCGNSVQQTSDGGYIIAGSTDSYGAGDGDVWLIKTDYSGNVAWNKTFGGSGHDGSSSVQQTSDGGYIIAGVTNSYGAGDYDVWLIKTDSSGNAAWSKTFGGSDHDLGNSVQQTSDGGYIIAGNTWSCGAGGEDVWLIKVTA